MTSLAQFIKERRKKIGLTQLELAEKSGLGLRFVRELEQGKTTLRMDKVNQLLGLFGSELVAQTVSVQPMTNQPINHA